MDNPMFSFQKVCRACKLESENLQSVFENCDTSSGQSKLADMLMACASVQVLNGDGLPSTMCTNCVQLLTSAYSFKRQCETSDTSLRLLLKQDKIKQENAVEELTDTFLTLKALFHGDVKREDGLIKEEFIDGEISFPCGVCSKQFASSAGLRFHRRIHDEGQAVLNKCKICAKEYSCLSHLQRHMRLHFPNKIYTCKICNKSLSRLEHLKRHMVIHLKTKPHVCRTCKRGFNKADNLFSHEQRCKGQRPHICEICNRGFMREDSLQVHLASHDANVEIQPMLESLDDIEEYIHVEECEGSVDAVIKQQFLEPQINIEERDPPEVVDVTPVVEEKVEEIDNEESCNDGCGAASPEMESDPEWKVPLKRKRGRPRKNEVRLPVKTKIQPRRNVIKDVKPGEKFGIEMLKQKHSTIGSFSCNVCARNFMRADHLRRHLNCHEESKPFVCNICMKSFARRDHMIRHVKLHAVEKEFECDLCQQKFSREELVSKHKAVKHGIGERVVTEKKYKCDICNKFFTTEKYRDIHLKAHSMKDKILQCKTCEKEFDTKDELMKHMKLTNDCSRRFLCSECGQRFTKIDYLQVHMRRHRGEKPFKCKYCEKGFPRTTDLKAHEKCHTGEKNHLCIVCGKGFGRAYKLTLHMRTHTGEKPYACTYCDAAFAQSNDLKAHVRRHTGERYHCDMCTDAFLMGYMLTQHKRNVHGVEVPPSQRPLARVEAPQPHKPNILRPGFNPRSGQMFSFAISQTLNLLNHPNYT